VTVHLHLIGGAWGTTSVSPFAIKADAYLRMSATPYQVAAADPRKAPRGKIPYATVDGETITDSQNIIEHLEARSKAPLDARLDAGQRARGHALRRMLEEGTYWALVHLRWVDEAGWATYGPVMRAFAPPVIRHPVFWMIRRGIRSQLHAQGTGRRPPEEIARIARSDFHALAESIEGPMLFGEEPTTFDASVYAFVVACAAFPVASPVRDFVTDEPRLSAYRRHVESRWYR
jgi:glutathione S-transferase